MDTSGPATDWGAETVPTTSQIPGSQPGAPAAGAPPATSSVAAPPTGFGEQEWNVGPTTATKDWADEGDWGSTEPTPVSHLT